EAGEAEEGAGVAGEDAEGDAEGDDPDGDPDERARRLAFFPASEQAADEGAQQVAEDAGQDEDRDGDGDAGEEAVEALGELAEYVSRLAGGLLGGGHLDVVDDTSLYRGGRLGERRNRLQFHGRLGLLRDRLDVLRHRLAREDEDRAGEGDGEERGVAGGVGWTPRGAGGDAATRGAPATRAAGSDVIHGATRRADRSIAVRPRSRAQEPGLAIGARRGIGSGSIGPESGAPSASHRPGCRRLESCRRCGRRSGRARCLGAPGARSFCGAMREPEARNVRSVTEGTVRMGVVRQWEALTASPSARVWLERAATGLLLLWIVLGGAHTAIVMARPQGVRAVKPAGAERTIGLTDATTGSQVTALAEALELVEADPRSPALVVLPTGTEPWHQTYVRYQLNHIVYPRPVD